MNRKRRRAGRKGGPRGLPIDASRPARKRQRSGRHLCVLRVCVCGGRGDGVVMVVWQESKFSCASQQSSLVEEREVSSRLPASSFTPGATQAAAAPRPGHCTCSRGRWRHCWNGWCMNPKTKPAMQATRETKKQASKNSTASLSRVFYAPTSRSLSFLPLKFEWETSSLYLFVSW